MLYSQKRVNLRIVLKHVHEMVCEVKSRSRLCGLELQVLDIALDLV